MRMRFLAAVLCLAILAGMPVSALAADTGNDSAASERTAVIAVDDSGKPVDHITWTLDETGTLTIGGTGNMEDYDYFSDRSPFCSDSWITSVVILPGVTGIGDEAFYKCSNLRSVTIPESVTRIGSYAFRDCCNLTDITIPEGVVRIEDKAFYGCSSLTAMTIPDSCTSIGSCAFSGCSSLTDLTLPEGVVSIGDAAFIGCTELADPDGFVMFRNVLYDYAGSAETVVIPDGVTSISSNAFSHCTMTAVTIPDSVTEIGESAFSECYCLTALTIPDSVTSIGSEAFSECVSLKEITLPKGVTSINDSFFYDCSSLTSVVIPEGVTGIDDYAFYGCSSLTSVTIPESVTSIGYYAFYGCSSLAAITIPDSVTDIGEDAFLGCFRLADSEGFVIVRDVLYNYTGSAEAAVIPDGVTYIGDSLFADCSSLKSVTIPQSVTDIGDCAFEACVSLADVYYGGTPAQWTSITIGNGNYILTDAAIHYESAASGGYTNPFADVQTDAYYYTPVLWTAGNGILYGIDDTHFGPELTCTRAEAITFLYRAAGEPVSGDTENPFTDVEADDYFYEAVVWGCSQGIVCGLTDTTFGPEEPVTRAQFLTFLWRYDGKPDAAEGDCGFVDVPDGAYYAEAVSWGSAYGITAGVDASHYGPDACCTRGQAVSLLYRYWHAGN